MGHSFTFLEMGHSFTFMPEFTQNFCNISTAISRGMQKSSHWRKRSLGVRVDLRERQRREIFPAAEGKTLETEGIPQLAHQLPVTGEAPKSLQGRVSSFCSHSAGSFPRSPKRERWVLPAQHPWHNSELSHLAQELCQWVEGDQEDTKDLF